jgi:hypothetical protein
MKFALIDVTIAERETDGGKAGLYVGRSACVVSTHADLQDVARAWRPGLSVATYVSGVHPNDRGATLWALSHANMAVLLSALAGRTTS